MKVGRLFIGWERTNEPYQHILASWQHSGGYWRWHISAYEPSVNTDRRFGFGPGMDMGRAYIVGRHFSGWIAAFGWTLSLRTQPPYKIKEPK